MMALPEAQQGPFLERLYRVVPPARAGEPYLKIHILAFVQQFDAEPPIGLKAGNLAKEQARGGAE